MSAPGDVDVHNKVDAANLIHELHAVCQQHSLASLHFVAMEQVAPLVATFLSLQADGFKDIILFLDNLGMIRLSIVDVTQNFESLLIPALVIEVPWRLGKAKDQNNDNLSTS